MDFVETSECNEDSSPLTQKSYGAGDHDTNIMDAYPSQKSMASLSSSSSACYPTSTSASRGNDSNMRSSAVDSTLSLSQNEGIICSLPDAMNKANIALHDLTVAIAVAMKNGEYGPELPKSLFLNDPVAFAEVSLRNNALLNSVPGMMAEYIFSNLTQEMSVAPGIASSFFFNQSSEDKNALCRRLAAARTNNPNLVLLQKSHIHRIFPHRNPYNKFRATTFQPSIADPSNVALHSSPAAKANAEHLQEFYACDNAKYHFDGCYRLRFSPEAQKLIHTYCNPYNTVSINVRNLYDRIGKRTGSQEDFKAYGLMRQELLCLMQIWFDFWMMPVEHYVCRIAHMFAQIECIFDLFPQTQQMGISGDAYGTDMMNCYHVCFAIWAQLAQNISSAGLANETITIMNPNGSESNQSVDLYLNTIRNVISYTISMIQMFSAQTIRLGTQNPGYIGGSIESLAIVRDAVIQLPDDVSKFAKLFNAALEYTAQHMLVKQGSDVLKSQLTSQGYNTRFYNSINKSVETLISDMFEKTTMEKMLQFTENPNNRSQLKTAMEKTTSSKFPSLVRKRNLFSFKNGIFCIESMQFYPYVDKVTNTPLDYINHILPPSASTSNYFDLDFVPYYLGPIWGIIQSSELFSKMMHILTTPMTQKELTKEHAKFMMQCYFELSQPYITYIDMMFVSALNHIETIQKSGLDTGNLYSIESDTNKKIDLVSVIMCGNAEIMELMGFTFHERTESWHSQEGSYTWTDFMQFMKTYSKSFSDFWESLRYIIGAATLRQYTKYADYGNIETSQLDTIFKSQGFMKESNGEEGMSDTVRMILALMGRMFYPSGKHDNLQIMACFIGESGTGKSTLINTLLGMIRNEEILAIGEEGQKTFSLENALTPDGQFARCAIGIDFKQGDNFPVTFFLRAIASEVVTICRKYMKAVSTPWRAPILIASNQFMKGVVRALLRRCAVVIFQESIGIRESDSSISEKMQKNRAEMIVKYTRAYLELCYNIHANFTKIFFNPNPVKSIQEWATIRKMKMQQQQQEEDEEGSIMHTRDPSENVLLDEEEDELIERDSIHEHFSYLNSFGSSTRRSAASSMAVHDILQFVTNAQEKLNSQNILLHEVIPSLHFLIRMITGEECIRITDLIRREQQSQPKDGMHSNQESENMDEHLQSQSFDMMRHSSIQRRMISTETAASGEGDQDDTSPDHQQQGQQQEQMRRRLRTTNAEEKWSILEMLYPNPDNAERAKHGLTRLMYAHLSESAFVNSMDKQEYRNKMMTLREQCGPPNKKNFWSIAPKSFMQWKKWHASAISQLSEFFIKFFKTDPYFETFSDETQAGSDVFTTSEYEPLRSWCRLTMDQILAIYNAYRAFLINISKNASKGDESVSSFIASRDEEIQLVDASLAADLTEDQRLEMQSRIFRKGKTLEEIEDMRKRKQFHADEGSSLSFTPPKKPRDILRELHDHITVETLTSEIVSVFGMAVCRGKIPRLDTTTGLYLYEDGIFGLLVNMDRCEKTFMKNIPPAMQEELRLLPRKKPSKLEMAHFKVGIPHHYTKSGAVRSDSRSAKKTFIPSSLLEKGNECNNVIRDSPQSEPPKRRPGRKPKDKTCLDSPHSSASGLSRMSQMSNHSIDSSGGIRQRKRNARSNDDDDDEDASHQENSRSLPRKRQRGGQPQLELENQEMIDTESIVQDMMEMMQQNEREEAHSHKQQSSTLSTVTRTTGTTGGAGGGGTTTAKAPSKESDNQQQKRDVVLRKLSQTATFDNQARQTSTSSRSSHDSSSDIESQRSASWNSQMTIHNVGAIDQAPSEGEQVDEDDIVSTSSSSSSSDEAEEVDEVEDEDMMMASSDIEDEGDGDVIQEFEARSQEEQVSSSLDDFIVDENDDE